MSTAKVSDTDLLIAVAEHSNYAEAGKALTDPGLPVVCRRLAVLAEKRFQEAHAMLGACDRRAMKPAIAMLEAYHRLLKKLQASDWRDPTQRASLPRLEKLWVALKHGFL